MPKILQAWNMSARMPEFLDSCARKFGDCFTISMPGIPPQIMFSNPAAVKQIFTADEGVFSAGQANSLPLGGLLGPYSVVRLDGPAHRSERRTLLPPFHPDRMEDLQDRIRSIAEISLERRPKGQPFKMFPMAFEISLRVILHAVFGSDNCPEFEPLRSLLTRLMTAFASPALLAPWMRVNLGFLTPWGSFVRLKQQVHEAIDREISRRRRTTPNNSTDILSVLLNARPENGTQLSDEQIRDELLTMVVAGSDTTASAMSWVFYRIAQDEEAARKLETELNQVAEGAASASIDLAKLRYLDAVIKETLRLHPVILAALRWVNCPVSIEGYDLPERVIVAPCSYLAHRRPETWSEPDRFLPERFLGVRPDPYTFFPFGGGDRRCVGMSLALFEIKAVLAHVLGRVRFRAVPGYVARPTRRSVTFAPSKGLPIVADLKP